MTNKHVADVVRELHEAVLARRQRVGTGAIPAFPDEPRAARPLSEGGDGVISIEVGLDDVSMPVISMSYDAERAADPPAKPITAGAIAAQAKPAAVQVPPIVPTKAPAIARVPTPRTLAKQASEAVIEIPIGDTISGAVEAIVLPDISVAVPAAVAPADEPSKPFNLEDDSISRAFDDLTEEPAVQRSRDMQIPTADELARKRPPTPPALADIAEPSDDAGDFGLTSPLRVLFRLMTARATGLLVVAVGGIKKEIYVRDGQPEYVSSNVASELFGNYLVTKGVLSDGELAMALAMMPHYGGKLGDTLVGLGLLKPLEVFRHLTRQVRTKIIDVCTWNKGGFAWYAGRENPREAFPLDFNAFEILGAGAMSVAEDIIETWVAKYGSLKLRASRTRRVGPERFEVKGLVDLFEALDGKKSVATIVEAESDRDDRIRLGRMLMLLDACDLARPA
jgi:hypothetical protein